MALGGLERIRRNAVITTAAEYARATRRLRDESEHLDRLREALSRADLAAEEVERLMRPALDYHSELRREVEAYERERPVELEPLSRLTDIGRWLTELRSQRGWTQQRLAAALGTSAPLVCRDERNGYRNISTQRAQRILDAFGAQISVRIERLAPVEQLPGASPLEVIRESLARFVGTDEEGLELWLTSPHPQLGGTSPQELLEAGEDEFVAQFVQDMVASATTSGAEVH